MHNRKDDKQETDTQKPNKEVSLKDFNSALGKMVSAKPKTNDNILDCLKEARDSKKSSHS